MATPDILQSLPDQATYRDQWARWQQRRRLAKVYKHVPVELQDLPTLPSTPLAEASPEKLPSLPKVEPTAKLPAEIKVCIVGAGAAGLFTAMIFDWLKSKSDKGELPDLHIKYDLFEAAGEDRAGGRLYTHHFEGTKQYPTGPHQYYDVGAMRFPDNPVMQKTFELFKLLGMKKRNENPEGILIDYFLKGAHQPSYFNDIHYFADKDGNLPKYTDPFKVLKQTGAPIPKDLLQKGTTACVKDAIEPYRQALMNDPVQGWNMLMDADKYSARDFLMLPPIGDYRTVQGSSILKDDSALKKDANPIGGPGYNFNTCEWIETFEGGTRWYSQAFSEMVLENLDFDWAEDTKWYCIEGGSNILAQNMAKTIAKKPKYKSPVTAIKQSRKRELHNLTVHVKGEACYDKYAAVFNSTTLGAAQRMDLTTAKLNYGTKQAIRTLNYGASCKVGIRFSYPWWIKDLHINKGGLGKTDLPIRVCVYPSYNTEDDKDKPAVLLCSYTWEQDASRMGSLIRPSSPDGEDDLKELLFRNLALLHSKKENYKTIYETIKSSYITHHAFNWYTDPYAAGAFAFFGPHQFQEVWPDIVTPSADGKLHFIGEAGSTHHAWVVGALESAIRGVCHFITKNAKEYKEFQKVQQYMKSYEIGKDGSNPEGPFLPLPYNMEWEVAEHQVLVSEARAEGVVKEVL